MALRLGPLDRWTLDYLGVATAAALWKAPPDLLPALAVAHLLLLAVALLAPRAREGGDLGAFLGSFYALIVTVALYSEVGLLNRAAGVSHDAVVQSWEAAIWGGQPSRAWIRSAPWPWLSWLMHLGYLSYYLILAGAPLALWLTGRRGPARRTLLLVAVTFYLCFTIFLIFPVAGPRYCFPPARNPATATAVAAFTHEILESGSAWGTAFPSSHVAAALVAALSGGRGWRPLGLILVPLVVLLALGTVYGQFHYAVDALCGGILGGLVLAVGRRR